MKKPNKNFLFIILIIFLILISFSIFILKESENGFEKNEMIRLDYPLPNQYISSPLTIKGYARGNWFFEGDFPIILTNWDGLIISESYASTKENWMTEDFIPFQGTLEFEKPEYLNRGTLILKKDNPTGLSQFDDALEINVFFE